MNRGSTARIVLDNDVLDTFVHACVLFATCPHHPDRGVSDLNWRACRQLPAPKNAAAPSARETAPPASSSAYDEALARKKNPKQMAAALFEKQLLAKRQQGATAADSDDAGVFQATLVTDSHGVVAEGQAVAESATGQSSAAAAEKTLPDGWGAAWDETAQAYYYYSSAGQTQWEVPSVHAVAGGLGQYQATQAPAAAPTGNAWDDPSLPPELRRELKRQAQRGGGGELQSFVGTAPVVTQQDFWNGEKHQEYTSMASAFHVPMNVCLALCPALATACSVGACACMVCSEKADLDDLRCNV
jgi:hypothetical protein